MIKQRGPCLPKLARITNILVHKNGQLEIEIKPHTDRDNFGAIITVEPTQLRQIFTMMKDCFYDFLARLNFTKMRPLEYSTFCERFVYKLHKKEGKLGVEVVFRRELDSDRRHHTKWPIGQVQQGRRERRQSTYTSW